MTNHAYDVNVYRDGKWWMIDVPALDALTQARRLADVETEAASLIAAVIDCPISAVEVTVVSIKSGDTDLLDLERQVISAREAADEATKRAATVTADTVRLLVAAETPIRDAGELLGISFQRVSQLANHHKKPATRRVKASSTGR